MHNKTSGTRISTPFLAVPVFLILYGIVRFIDGHDGTYGPGIAWTIGHIMFLCALLTLGLVIMELRRRNSAGSSRDRIIARLAAVVSLIGLVAFVRIAAIDLISGLLAANHSAMSTLQSQLTAYPNASLKPYLNIGPLLFQLGILALMIQLALLKPHRLPWWSPALLFVGFLVLGLNLKLLIPGAVLIGFALIPLSSSRVRKT